MNEMTPDKKFPDDSAESTPGARERALSQPEFPWSRIAGVLGMDPSGAEVVLRDAERAPEAVVEASRAFLGADDDRRAGRLPSSPIAAHPDFPTGVGMSLIGAGVLWEELAFVPRIALRVAKDHHEDGEEQLAASFAVLAQQIARPGVDDTEAWAAQALLVVVLQRTGSPDEADRLARDLAAHGVPLDLWRDDDPALPDESMTWHGGAFVEGMPPRRDGRAVTYEEAHSYLDELLSRTMREHRAEEDGGEADD